MMTTLTLSTEKRWKAMDRLNSDAKVEYRSIEREKPAPKVKEPSKPKPKPQYNEWFTYNQRNHGGKYGTI